MNYHDTLKDKILNRTAKVCVVGLGYVGLPTCIYVAKAGFKVVGIDIDSEKIEKLSSGVSPINEIIVEDNLSDLLEGGFFQFTTDYTEGIPSADIILLILPTPITKRKEPDLRFLIDGAKNIAPSMKKGALVILESTTYPGTTEELLKPILEEGSKFRVDEDFGLAYCPERFTPGDSEHTIINTTRILGGRTPEWTDVAHDFYSTYVNNIHIVNDTSTAEAAKVIENIQRDLNIALVNELALIFERLHLDVWEVLEAASTKWNFISMTPGPGVGGHCLPVDPYYLTYKAREVNIHPKVILAGREINDSMPHHVTRLISTSLNHVFKSVKGSTVVILGITYKPNTDDIRGSPALTIIRDLINSGADVKIVDDRVTKSSVRKEIALEPMDVDTATQDADVIALIVEHDEFLHLDLEALMANMNTDPIFVDTRNIFDVDYVKKAGFHYTGLGRG